jgi:erythromycin esterase-like protein
MSLLHQESEEELDVVARGEAFTKGSSHIVWASLSAVVLVSIIIAVYMFVLEKPPVARGEIVQVWAHPRHIVTSEFDANGEAKAQQSFDQVLVFAHVKLTNQSKVPIYLENVLANTKLADGTLSVSSGSAGQYEEAFLAYPELAALRSNALSPRAAIAPGESVDGNLLWALNLTKQEWDARKSLDFTFKFHYQASLMLAPHSAVTEQ